MVSRVIAAGDEIATRPYVYGGGHGSFESAGYDCSGSVSYALHGGGLLSSPEDSTGLESYGDAGPGKHITIYANAEHAFMVVDGKRFDTVALQESGSRWSDSHDLHRRLRRPPPAPACSSGEEAEEAAGGRARACTASGGGRARAFPNRGPARARARARGGCFARRVSSPRALSLSSSSENTVKRGARRHARTGAHVHDRGAPRTAGDRRGGRPRRAAQFAIVGLADAAVREARERVQAAILNCGFEFPGRRITANLAPGDVPKVGPGLDLALACGVLAASGQLTEESLARLCAVRRAGPRRGGQSLRAAPSRSPRPAGELELERLVLACERGREAMLVEGLAVAPVSTLQSAVRVLRRRLCRHARADTRREDAHGHRASTGLDSRLDLSDVRGQAHAVRAVIVCGSRRPQLPAERTAWRGQDDARPAAALDPAGAQHARRRSR